MNIPVTVPSHVAPIITGALAIITREYSTAPIPDMLVSLAVSKFTPETLAEEFMAAAEGRSPHEG